MSTRTRGRRILIGIGVTLPLLLIALFLKGRSELHRVPMYADDPVRVTPIGSLYQRIVAVRLLSDVGRQLRTRAHSDLELVQLAVDWTHFNVRGQAAADPDLIDDNTFGLIIRGRGWCNQVALVTATILWSQDIPVRLFGLLNAKGMSWHTVLEVEVNGRWVLVDPWYGTSMLRADGFPASVAQVSDTLLARWGLSGYKAFDYHHGFRWNAFPFMTIGDMVGRGLEIGRDRLTNALRSTPINAATGIAPRDASGTEPLGSPVAPVASDDNGPKLRRASKGRNVTAEFRRRFIDARMQALRGEDRRAEYTALSTRTADVDLQGALRYFTLLRSVASSEIPADFSVPGTWKLSGEELRVRLFRDTTAIAKLYNGRTVAENIKLSTVSTLPSAPIAKPAR